MERLGAAWEFRPSEQERLNYMPYFPLEVSANGFPQMPLLNKPADFARL